MDASGPVYTAGEMQGKRDPMNGGEPANGETCFPQYAAPPRAPPPLQRRALSAYPSPSRPHPTTHTAGTPRTMRARRRNGRKPPLFR